LLDAPGRDDDDPPGFDWDEDRVSYTPPPFPPPQGPLGYDPHRPAGTNPSAAPRSASILICDFGALLLLCRPGARGLGAAARWEAPILQRGQGAGTDAVANWKAVGLAPD